MSALEREDFGGGMPSLAVSVSGGKCSSHENNLSKKSAKVSYVLPPPNPALTSASYTESHFSEGENAIDSGVIQSDESCRCFSLDEIVIATNNFNDALVVGIGGFGKVYKGFVDNGATTVAIKRMNVESKQGVEEFWAEIKTLSKLRHMHLVALIGYCNDSQEMILVYEYVARGTLANHLYNISRKEGGKSTSPLTWEQRLSICIGAARGVDYLHTGTKQSIIHRDVKTTNILLDGKWVAKISDFGLSKSITTHATTTHVITNVKGTFGYVDPDYFYTRRLTKKSDVYAFGVVLFEVLCGRPPVDTTLEEEQTSLVLWAQQHTKKGKLDEIVDPSLIGQITPHGLKHFVELANKCLHISPKERPTVVEVVKGLEIALASHERKGRTQKMMSKVFQGINLCWRDVIWKQYLDNLNQKIQQLRPFSLAEIRAATNDFNKGLLIGRYRSHNELYKGCIYQGTLVVAIKKLQKPTSQRFLNEVGAEIMVQSLIRHPNIVSLIGFCYEKHELILVYEYLGNGSLEYHLYGPDVDPLLWKKRLEICIDTARGLEHLHTRAELQVIHRDMKPSNILLDDHWVAKVSDFRISRPLPPRIASEGLETSLSGTIGYLDPEYCRYGRLTKKSDVYSFGVVLMEVLCAKKPDGMYKDEEPLVDRFKSSIKTGTIDQVIDPYLVGKIAPECLRDFVKIALSCLVNEAIRRPSIDDVLGSLQSALQLQEAWENLVEIGVEIPVTDPSSYNDLFSIDTGFRIGGQTFFISDCDQPRSGSSSSCSE